MASKRGYHHGDLRAALVQAALAAVDAGGPEAVSLRELAEQLGVSPAAPYRHFPDRRALLTEVAALGFTELAAAYATVQGAAPNPLAALRETARVYLNLAFRRPGLFRLMFDSDLLDDSAPPTLLQPAGEAWEGLRRAVAGADPGASARDISRRTLQGWSTLHGFVALTRGARLKTFMIDPLSEPELIEAILDKATRSD